jgi:hypothetical protein
VEVTRKRGKVRSTLDWTVEALDVISDGVSLLVTWLLDTWWP